jgi:hypothetical protein
LELPALRGRRGEGIRRASGKCGGGRHSGVRCWRPRDIVALGWGCQQQEARAVRSKKATRGRGEQKAAGGELGRRITPAADEQERQSRGGKQRRLRKKGGVN